MTVHHLTDSDFRYTKLYQKPPQKNVLLLSCMDIRLLDNTTRFMDELNLQNRYDQLIFAGSSLGAGKVASEVKVNCQIDPTKTETVRFEWKHVFFAQLDAAVNLLKREIKDILILEHMDCGAYKHFQNEKLNNEYASHADRRELSKLEKYHYDVATPFAKTIETHCKNQAAAYPKPKDPEELKKFKNPWDNIQVHCLLMDLTGRVKDLENPKKHSKPN